MGAVKPEVVISNDTEELSARAAEAFTAVVRRAIEERGQARVALSGGKTPLGLYGLLCSNEFKERVEWGRVHLFWGDERCVPPKDPQSNYGAARPFIEALGVPEKNVHRIRGEDGVAAAREYEEEISGHFSLGGGEFPAFDLMLLGLGADGHIASIFPGTAAAIEERLMAVAVYVEKLCSMRITLTPPVVRNAQNIMVLASGPEKAPAFGKVMTGSAAGASPFMLPALMTLESRGRVLWIVDREAAGTGGAKWA